MTNEEKMEFIAETYGMEKQLPILAEECCELAQAALKLLRYPNKTSCKEHLCEELADVEIVISQIKHFIGAENVQPYITNKLDRQVERITSTNENCKSEQEA